MQKMISILLISLFAVTVVAQQQAAPSRRNMEKEKQHWQQLEKIAPVAVETFKAATEAFDKRDYDQAAKLYEEVFIKAPEFDVAARRLGSVYVELGKTAAGITLIEQAYARNASAENAITLARYLYDPGEGKVATTQERERALKLAMEASSKVTGDDADIHALAAQMALGLEKTAEFNQARQRLNRDYPNRWETHYVNAMAATMSEDWIKADDEINLAQTLGMPDEMAQALRDSGIHSRARVWHYLYYSLYLVVAWLIGLTLLFVLGKLFSGLTLRSIEQADPNGETNGGEVSLRAWYKRLINVAGVYYYVSLPVVVLLVIAVTGSIVYGFLMLGHIPIKLVFILVIGALITIFKMIHSLFIKIESEDPGRALQPEEAPGLWQLTREVAQAVGTRPIDEIRVTPGCDLAVYEKGSFREKATDRAKRILILGVGVLNDMQLNAFRAVLAHEYGHFSHRDTAGGDVALRVDRDMMKFAYAMALSGQAVWWNIAFQFLRVYHFIFRRLSYGATRLQEVLADRVAVCNFGAGSFEEGLRHVIRREVEFNFAASKEIEMAQMNQRALSNLYQLPELKGTQDEPEIEREVNEAVARPTSEDDTHPSPIDRFRLAARIVTRGLPPTNGMVWDLFANREALTEEMSKLIDERVKKASA
ncbi:MAG: M48 family metalloprotease [Acidobacteriota bacterium]